MITSLLVLVLIGDSGASALMETGDRAFMAQRYPEAIAAYTGSLAIDSSCSVLWRLSRVHVCLGDVSESPAREEHYQRAVGYANAAVMRDPASSEAHAWLAASLGCLAMRSSVKEKVRLSREIKKHADEAVRLNPRNDIALTILGSFYRELAKVGWLERSLANVLFGGLPTGSFEDSEAALQRAIAASPDVMRHYYELGKLYMDWNRPDDARTVLEQALSRPVLLASDHKRKERIQKYLNDLTVGR
jgi:tetratricopeptide (TPR) repeat protein